MGGATPAAIHRREYERAAMEYSIGLSMENLMENTAQARQRAITLASLAVVRAARPDIQTFNELLILYPSPAGGKRGLAGVVPDNMVVVHPEPITAEGSFNLPEQPAGPLVVMEYMSRTNRRKDYTRNRTRYRKDLEVPYYLLFDPERQHLQLLRRESRRYRLVGPDADGRRPIPELELGVGLLDEWLRYWFRGRLVDLPEELIERAERAERRVSEVEAENARLRAELDRLRGRPTNGPPS